MAVPRLTDVFGLGFTQEDVDFAIPKLDEDIPLYIDPFLLWNSEKPEYVEQHKQLVGFFDLVREHVQSEDISAAANLFAGTTEPREVGLGYASGSKRGSNIGSGLIADIIGAFASIPQLGQGALRHTEELQLVVPGIAEDRISDTAACVTRKFLIEYTAEQVRKLGIPNRVFRLGNVFDPKKGCWCPAPQADLPYDPRNGSPILLVPLDLLRHLPWINYPDYYESAYSKRVLMPNQGRRAVAKAVVLAYNARNYVEVQRYVDEKEELRERCKPDPLFKPFTIATLKAKFKELRLLPTGADSGASRIYEDIVSALFPSLFYPTFEFAESRVRTLSGTHIRDLIFYNDGKTAFWKDIRKRHEARQPVFELKNVQSLDPDHVDQLYRYLGDEFGQFGVLVSRNPAPQAVLRNTVDLHSSKRVVILCVDDRDVELMITLAESSRDPTDALKKKYVEFTRMLPK